MGPVESVALAAALSADCFSVSLGIGLDGPPPRRFSLLPLIFGIAQGILVTGGYWVARAVHWLIDAFALSTEGGGTSAPGPDSFHQGIHFVLSLAGATVMLALGIRLISTAWLYKHTVRLPFYRGRMGLLLLAFGVNVDALAAGLSLGMFDGVLVPPVIAVMAVVGGGLSTLGLCAGKKIGEGVGRMAQPVGGAVLILLALRVVVLALGRPAGGMAGGLWN